MLKTSSKFKKKCPPANNSSILRMGRGFGRYALFLFTIILFVGITQAAYSEPVTQRDLECMRFVTPDFQLLPGSSLTWAEQAEIEGWMFSGHLKVLIPRGDGYEVTIRYDNGTLETRYFSEFSNGQPFCPPSPGCSVWAYAFDEEEVAQAQQYYGQEITWLDLIKAVAPEEYENMDYTARAQTAYRIVLWPDDPEEFVAPWVLQYSHCSSSSHYQPAEVGSLFPDLSSESIGRRSQEGPGWKIEIVIQEPKDQSQNEYSSMADFYRVQYPEVYASLSATERQELESQPPRVGYVNIMTTPDREQQEISRTIWGTEITNEEYYTLLWPDLWVALPEWFRESTWADELYQWREPDPEHHSVPNDYILPEDRLPPSSNLPVKPAAAPEKDPKDKIGALKPNLSGIKVPSNLIFNDRETLPKISFSMNRTAASNIGEIGTQNGGSTKSVLLQASDRFTGNAATVPASLKPRVNRKCSSCAAKK